ncbi:MAG: tRNA lysidine(34) synthetase TilS [Candidatus Omnitrophica bacterium]|nr:tRNA lysidine(34) synthetase TilS [Candidatus Omnitrophota bacterium]MBD3268606.1 tRNA lysidine(34) synthetase TilS [Candidatus Omnitrophota bacterium]
MGLLDTVKKYKLVRKKDRIILGISGGPDSVFMLHEFLKIQDDYKLTLVCAHLNHSLRKEADEEEGFVRKLCKEVKVKLISEKRDVRRFCKEGSIEQTARNLRFDFFMKCCRQTKIKKISLAHHKDDLAETVLMRLIRGSGLKGLRGFLPLSKYKSVQIIRPLIEIRKTDIISKLREEKIDYCLDKSNFEDKFLRNKIRLQLLPLLRRMNPNIEDSLYNICCNVALDYDFISSFSRDKFDRLKLKESTRTLSLDLKGMKQLVPAIFNNVLMIAIEELKGNTRRIETRHLDEIKDLIHSRPCGSVVDLPFMLARKTDRCLVLESTVLKKTA